MPVPIEFINLIVRRSALDKIYQGGSLAFIEKFGPFDGNVNAHDDSLIKFGAMNPIDIESLADTMESIGLVGITEKNGKEVWTDFCVIDAFFGLTLPCDWIYYDSKSRSAECISPR